jgi:NAD(P)-dependent dehydrogenase (short-subunit alcohol dehydrogenase family)
MSKGDLRTVLVTGASSGIGCAGALHLDRVGYRVFAGVRRSEDGDRLTKQGSSRLAPIHLDVTNPEDIRNAVRVIDERAGGELYGLVNNAGICLPSALELVPLTDFRKHLEVNLVGPVALIQALLPSLRRATGRIVNVGSVNGQVVLLGAGAYSASKFALEAISDVLRLELRPWGIHVSQIEPGGIQTEIFDKARREVARTIAGAPDELCEAYRSVHDGLLAKIEKAGSSLAPSDQVAVVIAQALGARRPRARYYVGRNARLFSFLKRLLPDRALDGLLAWRSGGPRLRD